MKKPTCETCPYWDRDKELHCENEGECRRRSPSRTNSNPTTISNEWCGEHPDFNEWIESQKKKGPSVSFRRFPDSECRDCYGTYPNGNCKNGKNQICGKKEY